MRKKALLTLAIVLSITTITVLAAATASGSFSLSYGAWERSSYATLEASYPYVKYTAQNSGNSTIRVTLSKKGFLGIGFDNLEVKSISINGNSVSYAYFSKQDKNKDYLITNVNDKSGSIANAKYTLTSKSTAGAV